MKKGRHRRYEEARALKRSSDGEDIESLMERLNEDPFDLPTTDETDRPDQELGENESAD